MRGNYYQSSGKFSPVFFLFFCLALLIAVPIMSFIYVHILYFMPFIYINIIVTALCGALLGLVFSWAGRLGAVRNMPLMVILTVLGTLIMKYVMWTFYVPLVYANSYEMLEYTFVEGLELSLGLLISPQQLWQAVQEINEVGVWSVRSIEGKGIFLYIVWAVELGILIVTAIITMMGDMKRPYCEETNRWYKKNKEITTNATYDMQDLKQRMEKGDYAEFITLLSAPLDDTDVRLKITYYSLDDITHGFVSIDKSVTQVDRKGKKKETTTTVFELMEIKAEALAHLRTYQEREKNEVAV